jgi:hypothetical protein
VTRDEKIALCRKLKAEGLTYRQVAEAVGTSKTTVVRWLNPDKAEADRVSARARKESYRGECATCGAPTNGSGPGSASDTCLRCFGQRLHDRRIWTPETIIEAIRAWEAEYGFVPVAADWSVGMARERQDAEVRLRRYYEGRVVVPATTAVLREFGGSWNAAIEAAGFTPNRPGHYGRLGEDPDHPTVQEAIRLYKSGLGTRLIARRLGVSEGSVGHWLHRAGVPMRTAAAGIRLYFANRDDEQVAA